MVVQCTTIRFTRYFSSDRYTPPEGLKPSTSQLSNVVPLGYHRILFNIQETRIDTIAREILNIVLLPSYLSTQGAYPFYTFIYLGNYFVYLAYFVYLPRRADYTKVEVRCKIYWKYL